MRLRPPGSGETRSVEPDVASEGNRFVLSVGDFGKDSQCLDALIFRAVNVGRPTFVANGSMRKQSAPLMLSKTCLLTFVSRLDARKRSRVFNRQNSVKRLSFSCVLIS